MCLRIFISNSENNDDINPDNEINMNPDDQNEDENESKIENCNKTYIPEGTNTFQISSDLMLLLHIQFL